MTFPDISSAHDFDCIIPRWPAPAQVRAACTTRAGGASPAPYESLNLGDHVGDDPLAVSENRARLRRALSLPNEPRWLQQVHGVCAVDGADINVSCQADACFAAQADVVCAVLTADCLPLLMCDRAGTQVAAVHAGWRGLVHGVIENSLDKFTATAADMLVWLGPAIGPQAFEVGEEVRAEFVAHDSRAAAAFLPRGDRWLANIYTLARQRLAARGVTAVFGGEYCTYSDAARFYSYRRDGVTGRMASLIWLERGAM
ncbi:MAG: peptidoglycan editing factor PgeF [Gammaproteobacteria bacterium]